MPEMSTAEIAALCGAHIEGDATRQIRSANTLEAAGESEVAFVDNKKSFPVAERSRAGCLIAPQDFDRSGSWTLLRVTAARQAFARAVSALYARPVAPPDIHSTALIDASAEISPGATIGPYVTIGARAKLASGCIVAAGCRVGEDVHIGADTTLHPNVTIYNGVRIGERVVLHSGCVLGADGFGYLFAGDHYEKFPQVGTVEIDDDVELGANTCVDRAALGVTRIGTGSKLDNLVHVAHNCNIGRHVVIAAQTGLSGSVTIGDYAVIGGQAGVGEKAQIAAKAVVGGKAGVLTGQHVDAGEPVWGIPARPLRQHLKNLAHVSKLGRTEETLRQMKKRMDDWEKAESA